MPGGAVVRNCLMFSRGSSWVPSLLSGFCCIIVLNSMGSFEKASRVSGGFTLSL